ncbi:hypothetical protein D3C71_899570 [compost metagenome]
MCITRIVFIIGFSFASVKGSAQRIVTEKEISFNLSHLNNLGKELVIKKNDSTLLAPDKYQCDYTRRDKKRIVSFVINAAGKPDGVVDVDGKFKTFVRNGMMYRYEDYHEDSHRLITESYMRGDTIVWKMYNKYSQLRAENWRINEKTIYDFDCDCDTETDSIKSCTLVDELNGLQIHYGTGGQIAFKVMTKNLPEGVTSRSEEYDEKGKLTIVLIHYNDDTSKTTYSNGEYIITKLMDEGSYIEKFTSKGELIEKYILPYPTSK